jgi:hypothetical protein
MAEEVGFEPTEPCGSPVFKTGAIDHSATPPASDKIPSGQTRTQAKSRRPNPKICRAIVDARCEWRYERPSPQAEIDTTVYYLLNFAVGLLFR